MNSTLMSMTDYIVLQDKREWLVLSPANDDGGRQHCQTFYDKECAYDFCYALNNARRMRKMNGKQVSTAT